MAPREFVARHRPAAPTQRCSTGRHYELAAEQKCPAAWSATWSTPPHCDGSCETRRYMPRLPGLGGGADTQVNPLVVKAHQVRDAAGVGNRRLVTPHDILMDVVANLDRPVGRLAFAPAGRRVSRRPQQLSADIIARDVVAGRQASFLETDGPIRLGERLTTEPDLDVHVSRNDRDLVSSSHTTGNRPKVRTIPAWAMGAPPDKKPPRQDHRSRSMTPRAPGNRSSAGRSTGDSASVAERALIGDIRLEAGRAFSAARRLRARGLNVVSEAALPEKEKVSITLYGPLVDDIRCQ